VKRPARFARLPGIAHKGLRRWQASCSHLWLTMWRVQDKHVAKPVQDLQTIFACFSSRLNTQRKGGIKPFRWNLVIQTNKRPKNFWTRAQKLLQELKQSAKCKSKDHHDVKPTQGRNDTFRCFFSSLFTTFFVGSNLCSFSYWKGNWDLAKVPCWHVLQRVLKPSRDNETSFKTFSPHRLLLTS